MAIPQARIDIATDAYIESNFNATKAYQAAHPNASIDTAYGNGTTFIDFHGIREKALEKIRNDKKLSLDAVLNSFTKQLDATNGVYFKGEKIADEPNHSAQLQAKMFIVDKVYGLGQQQINIDNRRVNVSLQMADTDKLSSLINSLERLQQISAAHSSKREQAVAE